MKIIIFGAGIAGLATALALSIHISPAPEITVIELRATPSTIGGAIGLTPNALRALNHLGVLERLRKEKVGCEVEKIELFNMYSGGRLGHISFEGAEGKGVGKKDGGGGGRFKGLRIMRRDLMEGLVGAVRERKNVSLRYGLKAVGIEEGDGEVLVRFENGEEERGDVLVGCDGVHSYVRTTVVEPERKPEYTGIAAVFGFTDIEGVEEAGEKLPWDTTALCQGKRGSLLCAFYEEGRKKVYTAAIMETKDVQSKEGWKAMSREQEEIKKSVWERYRGSGMGCLEPLIEKSRDWVLYPVYTLSPKGRWSSKRTMLLGDAAHAVSSSD
jgi:salicylate hydroxylase